MLWLFIFRMCQVVVCRKDENVAFFFFFFIREIHDKDGYKYLDQGRGKLIRVVGYGDWLFTWSKYKATALCILHLESENDHASVSTYTEPVIKYAA